MNSRQEIPLWTWYNGQFLFQFDEQLKTNPNKTISEFYSDFLQDQKLQDHEFYHTKNQGTVLLLMYGLIVIPREIWEKSTTNFKFNTRNKFVFKLPTGRNVDTFDFLRLLRNSLSHANFSVNVKTMNLNFWNVNRHGVKDFEVEIKYDELGDFLAEIGKYYVNEVKLFSRE
jgi:hypothetical protein